MQLEDEDFDAPLGESTGAAVIFGATGGVMEAALRTAYEIHTGKTLDNVDFEGVRAVSYTHLDVYKRQIHNVIDILEKIENDELTDIDFLELRACDHSCACLLYTSRCV